VLMPISTLENIFPVVSRNRIEGGLPTMSHPTVGALIIDADLDLKIRKSIQRKARKIAFRLCFSRALLRLEIFLLQVSFLPLKLRCDLARYLNKLALS
jgi:hypothetical protein